MSTERKHLVQSAGYWFATAKQNARLNPQDAIMAMENAYNHVENALAASTDELTRLRAEVAEAKTHCAAANKGAERNAWINMSLAKQVGELRAENERLKQSEEVSQTLLRAGTAELQAHIDTIKERDSLRAQLATISAERDEARENATAMRHDVWTAEGLVSKLNEDNIRLTAAAVVKDVALRKIAKWFDEFPETGKTWPDGEPMSYGIAFGSNGERDYMREVANAALSPTENPLLADLQAAAVALEDVTDALTYFHNSEFWKHEHAHSLEDGCAALARLARWIIPAIEQ